MRYKILTTAPHHRQHVIPGRFPASAGTIWRESTFAQHCGCPLTACGHDMTTTFGELRQEFMFVPSNPLVAKAG